MMKQKKSLLAVMVLVGSVVGLTAQTSTHLNPSPSKQSAETIFSKNYLLGPGDVLEVKLFGQPDFNSTPQVDSDGNISSLPFIEKPVPALCRTELQVQQSIAEAYKKIINEPQVSVRIIERNSRQPASVWGAVRQPQRFPMLRPIRLNELMAASGGVTERASGTIQILHTEPVMCPQPGQEADAAPISGVSIPLNVVSIADMRSGKLEANPVIRPGDYVVVTEAEPVYITGSVVTPGQIQLVDKLTLSRAIAMVGGMHKIANLSDVRIYRQRVGASERRVLHVNFASIKKNQAADVLLEPYDVIEVRDAGPSVRTILTEGLAGLMRASLGFPGLPLPR